MKILWLSPTPSHPQTAGNRVHIYQLGKCLIDEGHEIIFVLYNQENASNEDIEAMRHFWPNFFVVPVKTQGRKKTCGEVWGIDDWFSSDLEPIIKFFSQQGIKAIICEYVFMSKAFTYVSSDTVKILDCHDRMSNRHKLLLSHDIKPDFFYTSEAQERIALNRADIILAIQNEEKKYFESLTHNIVLELGYMGSADPLPILPTINKLRIGIIGSSNSLNKKSVHCFFDVLQQSPDIRRDLKIIMAGTLGNEFAHEADLNLGVIKDENIFYNNVDLVINPMIGGTGLKIKTVCAIQRHKPFLSTVAGTIGLPVNHPGHQCSNIKDFIPFLQKLCNKEQRDILLNELRDETLRLSHVYELKQKKYFQKFKNYLNDKKKKVLIVTEIPFWENGVGSHSRILNLCNALKKKFRLKIFFFGSIYPERIRAIEAQGLSQEVISYKEYEERSKNIPYVNISSDKFNNINMKKHQSFVKSLYIFLSEEKFHTIIIEYIWNAYLKDAIKHKCLTILDTHDVMSFRKYSFLNKEFPLDITLNQELEIYKQFNSVLFIQKKEYDYIKACDCRFISVCCSHNISRTLTKNPYKGIHFGFIAGNSAVNKEAITFFIENIWKFQNRNDAVLHIYGNICKEMYISNKKIITHGLINNLNEIYSQCNIMINPVAHGSGLKIKSVEAIAFGKPLIASPEAISGIQNPELCGIIVAKNRTDFITAMLRLSYDRVFLERLTNDAKIVSKKIFSNMTSYDHLIRMIESY